MTKRSREGRISIRGASEGPTRLPVRPSREERKVFMHSLRIRGIRLRSIRVGASRRTSIKI